MMKRTTYGPPIRAFFERDRIPTLNIAGILSNDPDAEIFVDDVDHPRGVFVKGPWCSYVHTRDEACLSALFRMLDAMEGIYRFSGVWKPLAERIMARYPVAWNLPCDLYHLPLENHRPWLVRRPVRRVALEDAEIVDTHYICRFPGSHEEIRSCIRDRDSSAVYVDGRPVCWLLVHDDDSLGVVHTLEEYRRMGYATDITADLSGKFLAQGKTPFLQIRCANHMSPGLALKCGYVSQERCNWFCVLSGTPRELVESARELRGRRRERGIPDPSGAQAVCLCKLLPEAPADGTELERVDPREWQESSSGVLEGVPALHAEGWTLLRTRRTGEGAAAVLGGRNGHCELTWFAHPGRSLLQGVLRSVRQLGFDTIFVHVPEESAGAFESLEFLRIPLGD